MQPSAGSRRVTLSSDKCDFRIQAGSLDLRGQLTASGPRILAGLPNAGIRIDSAKCDWRVGSLTERFDPAGIRPDAFAMPRAAKREWLTASTTLGRPAAQLVTTDRGVEVTAGMGPVRVNVGSEKCDWLINATGPDRIGDVRVSEGGINVRVSGRGFGGAMSSDKCDWLIHTREELVSRPGLEARLTSKAGKYQLQLEVGVAGGPRVRLVGVGSSKCDFRLENIAQTLDGATWREIPTGAKPR